MATDTRPTSLTANHNYNLRNQGWHSFIDCAPDQGGDGGALLRDPITYTKEKIGVYPSNADIWYYNKLSTAERVSSIGTYSPWHLRRYSYGNTPAPRGHYILNAFDRNRSNTSGVTNVYVPSRDVINARPIDVEFYAGRVWYLMPDGSLYFS